MESFKETKPTSSHLFDAISRIPVLSNTVQHSSIDVALPKLDAFLMIITNGQFMLRRRRKLVCLVYCNFVLLRIIPQLPGFLGSTCAAGKELIEVGRPS